MAVPRSSAELTRRELLWAFAVAAGFVVLAFPMVVLGGRSFSSGWKAIGVNGFNAPPPGLSVPRDNIRIDPGASAWQFDPWAEVTNRAWRDGEVPLWNPYQGMGTPHAANFQSAVFDPLLAAVNLHPTPLTWDLAFLLALWLGAAAMYLFLRDLGLVRVAAITGTATLILSGYFFLYSNNHFFRSYLYLPALFLLARRTVASRHWLPPVALGVAVAGNLLIGMPETSLFVLGALGLYGAFLVAFPPEGVERRSGLVRFTSAALLGVCLAAPLLVPAAEFTKLAYSTHEKGSEVGEIFAKPREMLGWLAPFALGDPTRGLSGLPFSGTRDWIGAGGAIAVFGALAAPATMRRHTGWFFAALGGLVLAKCYGLPILNSVGALPVLERSNFVVFALPVAGFCGAVLVAIAVQALALGEAQLPKFLVVSAIPAFGLLILVWLNRSILSGASAGHLTRHLGVAAAAGAAAFGAFWCRRWRRELVLAGVVIAELVVIAPRSFQHERADAFVRPPWLHYVLGQNEGHGRVYATDAKLFPNVAAAFGLEDVRALDALYLDRYVAYLKAFVQPTFHNKFVGGPIVSDEAGPGDIADNPMFDLMGVQFVITGGTSPGSTDQYPKRTSSDGAHVYENMYRAPRALVLDEVTPVGSEREALMFLESSGQKQPSGAVRVTALDPKRQGVVEGLPAADAARINTCRQPGTASITSYRSSRVVMVVDSPCPGFALLTDLYYPGWKAKVNGRPVPIRATDVAFRGVVVPAGMSTVEFLYAPRSFRLGLFIALFAVAATAAAILGRRLWALRRS